MVILVIVVCSSVLGEGGSWYQRFTSVSFKYLVREDASPVSTAIGTTLRLKNIDNIVMCSPLQYLDTWPVGPRIG